MTDLELDVEIINLDQPQFSTYTSWFTCIMNQIAMRLSLITNLSTDSADNAADSSKPAK